MSRLAPVRDPLAPPLCGRPSAPREAMTSQSLSQTLAPLLEIKSDDSPMEDNKSTGLTCVGKGQTVGEGIRGALNPTTKRVHHGSMVLESAVFCLDAKAGLPDVHACDAKYLCRKIFHELSTHFLVQRNSMKKIFCDLQYWTFLHICSVAEKKKSITSPLLSPLLAFSPYSLLYW